MAKKPNRVAINQQTKQYVPVLLRPRRNIHFLATIVSTRPPFISPYLYFHLFDIVY
jgi:hypothetical protein